MLKVKPTNRPVEAGFTLVEMLVVLGIFAAVAALAASLPWTRGSSPAVELRTHALRIAAGLRGSRASAIRQAREVAFHFDAQENSWTSGQSGRPTQLPKGMTLTLETARLAIRSGSDARLVFFHDGSSTGGRIALSNHAGRISIDVTWINGAVSIDALQ